MSTICKSWYGAGRLLARFVVLYWRKRGEITMAGLKLFLRRHILWVGFLAVFIPLLVMLWMQYRSLAELEKTSAVADKIELRNHLKPIIAEIQYFYRVNAEQALNISSGSLTDQCLSNPGCCFRNR